MNSEPLNQLVSDLAECLVARGWYVTTAESCTGGGVAYTFTELSGSSSWFEAGFVVYSNRIKHEMLGVSRTTLHEHGAVSQMVVEQMAMGALNKSGANISVAISGIAGPDGGSVEKPVGTIWFAWAVNPSNKFQLKKQNHHASLLGCHTELHQLEGDRESIREQAIVIAIKGLIEQLSKTPV
ncbi:MAG: nicotinamide-nucleotide amidohydrolase family protein [Cellvibrionaceae bacterium]